MASDSGLFRTSVDGDVLPLYEAKMVHHFDHRLGTYEGQTEAQANMGTLPRLTREQQDAPSFARPAPVLGRSHRSGCPPDQAGLGEELATRVAQNHQYD